MAKDRFPPGACGGLFFSAQASQLSDILHSKTDLPYNQTVSGR
jgi:hypothetical protein